MDDFEALNINSIPRRKNMVVDALTISASALQLVKRMKLKRFLVELVVVSSIPNNIKNFQIFQDDQHIIKFIMCNGHFKGQEIDETLGDKPEDDELEDEDGILNLREWLNWNIFLIMMNWHLIEEWPKKRGSRNVTHTT